MNIVTKEGIAGAYVAFAILEVATYILSGFTAIYVLPLALASVVAGISLRQGYGWASILVWATGIVTLVFAFSVAYASLLLGSASVRPSLRFMRPRPSSGR